MVRPHDGTALRCSPRIVLTAQCVAGYGAVDALPVHESEPLALSHHHDDAAHGHAKHGSVLDGLRELELDLELVEKIAEEYPFDD